jgi:hypothetical protein
VVFTFSARIDKDLIGADGKDHLIIRPVRMASLFSRSAKRLTLHW